MWILQSHIIKIIAVVIFIPFLPMTAHGRYTLPRQDQIEPPVQRHNDR